MDGFVPGFGLSAKDLGSCSLVPPLSGANRMREVTKGRQKRPPLYKEGAEAAVEKFRRDRDS